MAGLVNNRSRATATLMLPVNGQIIQPASVAFVTSHDTRDDATLKKAGQKQIRPDLKLAPYIFLRIIPCPNQITTPPERNNRSFIAGLEWPNLHDALEDTQRLG